ncbi:MAG: HAAS signaling domain-containing protein [Nocardioides sp.]
MNDTTRVEVRPEVTDFLDKVRARLSDLSEEQRDDLLGGLEADLSELVADGGSVAELGDPRAYADELRSAAGVVPATRAGRHRPRLPAVPTRASVTAGLDGARERWESLMATGPWTRQGWEIVQTIRPAWWVLRAWVAVQILDLYTGPWEHATLVPRFGDNLSGLLLLLAATAGSVLLGLRKLWPAAQSPGSVLARVVLLGLNALAVLLLVNVADSFPSSDYLNEQSHPCAVGSCGYVSDAGLVNDGHRVRNVFAYDADGNPLQGVQLFDQAGKPLAVDPDLVGRMRYAGRLPRVYAWSDGEQQVWNAYPLPVRFDDGGWGRKKNAWTSDNPPFLPQSPPLPVAPVFLPLPDTQADEGPSR